MWCFYCHSGPRRSELELQWCNVGRQLTSRLQIRQCKCCFAFDEPQSWHISIYSWRVFCFFPPLSSQFQALPYLNSMSLSDPSLAPLGTASVTPKQQAQAREMLMNSSMMYMHQVGRISRSTVRLDNDMLSESVASLCHWSCFLSVGLLDRDTLPLIHLLWILETGC